MGVLTKLIKQKETPMQINEATYYGKNVQLLRAEKIIENMKSCYGASNLLDPKVSIKDIDKFYKYSEELEKVFAELFGFKKVFINRASIEYINLARHIISILRGQGINKGGAFTMPVHSSIDAPIQFILGNFKSEKYAIDQYHNGVRFKDDAYFSLHIHIDDYMFLDRKDEKFLNQDVTFNNLTPQEILAILLHEIGHNFYKPPLEILIDIIQCINPLHLLGLLTIMGYFFIFKILDVLNDIIPGAKYINTKFNVLRSFINKHFMNFIGDVIKTKKAFNFDLIKDFITVMSSITHIAPIVVRSLSKYDGEKYSDSFATAFGYGAELSSALLKLKDYGSYIRPVKDATKSFPIVNLYLWVNGLVSNIFGFILAPHPDTVGRINNNLRYMEEAADKIENPRLRKEYMESLKAIKQIKDDLKNYEGLEADKLDMATQLKVLDAIGLTDKKDWISTLRSKYPNLDID